MCPEYTVRLASEMVAKRLKNGFLTPVGPVFDPFLTSFWTRFWPEISHFPLDGSKGGPENGQNVSLFDHFLTPFLTPEAKIKSKYCTTLA